MASAVNSLLENTIILLEFLGALAYSTQFSNYLKYNLNLFCNDYIKNIVK